MSMSKFGPIEAYKCRVIANWFFPSNGIKIYFNGPLTKIKQSVISNPLEPSLVGTLLGEYCRFCNTDWLVKESIFLSRVEGIFYKRLCYSEKDNWCRAWCRAFKRLFVFVDRTKMDWIFHFEGTACPFNLFPRVLPTFFLSTTER